MKHRRILWKNVTAEDWHLARWTRTPSFPLRMHDHDFAEITWVEDGYGYHIVNDEKQEIARGDLIFIRPENFHGIEAPKGVTATNLAFPRSTLQFLTQRYPDECAWSPRGKNPKVIRLNENQISWLISEGDKLYSLPRKTFHAERFILSLLHLLSFQANQSQLPLHSPEWLRKACVEIQLQKNFCVGIARFFELAGRSPEHVTRVTHALTGITPTEHVNKARMSFAAQQLAMTDESIIEISMDCGIENLSHFYRLFTAHFKIAPNRYRKKQKSLGI